MFIPLAPSRVVISSNETSILYCGFVASTRRQVRFPRPSPMFSPSITDSFRGRFDQQPEYVTMQLSGWINFVADPQNFSGFGRWDTRVHAQTIKMIEAPRGRPRRKTCFAPG